MLELRRQRIVNAGQTDAQKPADIRQSNNQSFPLENLVKNTCQAS